MELLWMGICSILLLLSVFAESENKRLRKEIEQLKKDRVKEYVERNTDTSRDSLRDNDSGVDRLPDNESMAQEK